MKVKNWLILVCGIVMFGIVGATILNIVVDPFFHYHKGLDWLEYPLNEERYQNDGIQRYYEYEIMLTGTSMTQNFNASKVEELWDKSAIKTAYSGATFHELGNSMRNAIRHNAKLKTIICSLDANKVGTKDDEDTYEGTPTYLYDENLFNDVSYLLNKDVILKSIAVLNYTRAGNKTPSMDEYGRFDIYQTSGRDAVLSSFSRMEKEDLSHPFTEKDKEIICKNVVNNYVNLAKENPDVEFIFFIPPYSYCYWDAMVRTNQLDYGIESIKYATEILLKQENISVYVFDDWTDVTTNLNYYTDTLHYTGEICDRIVDAIYLEKNKLTLDSCQDYFERIRLIYKNMEYDF